MNLLKEVFGDCKIKNKITKDTDYPITIMIDIPEWRSKKSR